MSRNSRNPRPRAVSHPVPRAVAIPRQLGSGGAQAPPISTDTLNGMGLFDSLGQPVRHQLIRAAQPRRYERGEVLYAEGSASEELLLLMSGVVVLFRSTVTDQRAMLSAVRPPSVFGEEALAGGVPRAASAEALRDSFALALPVSALADIMRRHPAVADAARRWLAGQLTRLAEQHADNVLLDLPGRVAKMLVGYVDGAPSTVVDLSQSTLAGLARASRQSVNQTLQGFARRGWLQVGQGQIVVTDVEAMRRRAGLHQGRSSPGTTVVA